jgi:hypothetical protein
VTIPSAQPQEPVADGRKKIKDEITRHLDDMVASKRPAKSVRMHRNFLNAFSDASKPYCDEYGRDDVLRFRNRLLEERYGHKYIDTQMNTIITFFKRWLKMPICMEQKDWLETPPNPPEPYQDWEVGSDGKNCNTDLESSRSRGGVCAAPLRMRMRRDRIEQDRRLVLSLRPRVSEL